MDGILVYPKEKKEKITLTPEKAEEIENMIHDIKKIVSKPHPPPVLIKPYCKGCTYYELCMV